MVFGGSLEDFLMFLRVRFHLLHPAKKVLGLGWFLGPYFVPSKVLGPFG